MSSIVNLNMLAQTVSGQLGKCLADGIVVLFFAVLLAHILRRESSRARFWVWFMALLAVGGMPLFGMAWPRGTAQSLPVLQSKEAAIILPGSWALYLFSAWLVVVGIALARIAAGFWQVHILRKQSTLLAASDLTSELQETLAQFRPARKVVLLVSHKIHSPTAIGLWSPAIVLPGWLLKELSPSELRHIFLHELEHLRRWDDWSNLAQKIIKAIFFFHPAVWWMERQISLEREMACDEAVLARTDDPRAYAQCLVLLAEKSFFRRGILLAQAAVSRVGQTSARIIRILRMGRPRTTALWKLIIPCFALVLMAGFISQAREPQLIGFARTEPEFHPVLPSRAALNSAKAPDSARMALLRLPDARQSFHTNSSAQNAPGKPLAKISASSGASHFHPQVAAKDGRLAKSAHRNSSTNMVVEAELSSGWNGQSVMVVQQDPGSGLVVVFMENRPSGFIVEAVWQLEMWHIAILRSGQNPVPQGTPQKVI